MYAVTDSIFCGWSYDDRDIGLVKQFNDNNIKLVVMLNGVDTPIGAEMAKRFAEMGLQISYVPPVESVVDYSRKLMSVALNHVVFNAVMDHSGAVYIWCNKRDGVLINFLYDVLCFLTISDGDAREILTNALELSKDELSSIDSCVR